jgi:hypothetical protein
MTRTWPLATVVFGLATLAVFVAFNLMPAVTAFYAPGDAGPAISEFQRAETMADLRSVFGDPPDPRAAAAMDAINTLDLYVFIPAYAMFLIAAAAMLAGGAARPFAWPAIALAALGAGADAVETVMQLNVTADWANAETQLPIAPWHWVKYGLLSLNGVAVALICFLSAQKRWFLGVLALAPHPIVIAAWLGMAEPRLFSLAFALYWLALLAIAVMETVRARGAQA